MKATRIFLVAVLAFVVANCADQGPLGVTADQPTSGAVSKVTTGPQKDLLGGLLGGLGLLRCSPLPPATSTATIGPLGGTLKVGPHTLVVPAGALADNVTITGALASGSYNAVTFQPEGLQFARSASLTMSYANCGL
ncbi:MAG TPA: hypothetical protein VH113_09120, partial [Gemmatimonadales bacterium]|nr:hypothetical protein [Gemmatimonadales bacterium]